MACCPKGSLPYLEATYETKGTIIQTPAVEMYCAPIKGEKDAYGHYPHKGGIVMCPDVWGWGGGRTRAIADGLAEQGYIVVVGKFLSTPAKDGGTDGDGLSPNGQFDKEWIGNFPWPKQKVKVAGAIGYLKGLGVTSIGLMGFCYGGHLCAWASTLDPIVRKLHPRPPFIARDAR